MDRSKLTGAFKFLEFSLAKLAKMEEGKRGKYLRCETYVVLYMVFLDDCGLSQFRSALEGIVLGYKCYALYTECLHNPQF